MKRKNIEGEKKSSFSPIAEIIEEIKAGKMVIVTDDENRENEGDLVMSASKVRPEDINFMSQYGRGLICVPITESRTAQLGLELMVSKNRDPHTTNFTVSVDANIATKTGISTKDRAETIKILSNPLSSAQDLRKPGHIFPLQAVAGGVLERAGHTEAALDLSRLAGLDASAVICEILNDDGSMARLPNLLKFQEKHHIKMCSIRDLIAYRHQSEQLIQREEEIVLPTHFGNFQMLLYRTVIGSQYHVALKTGEINSDAPVLVRVHSECLTGDVFSSLRCDCGKQLESSLEQLAKSTQGVLVYMRQEGRGIGLAAKIHAYKLQEQGLDTVEANEKLGFPPDLRYYGLGAQILADLGVKKIRLLTNNPRKVIGLEGYGMEIVECLPIQVPSNPHNVNYLETKKTKLGHFL